MCFALVRVSYRGERGKGEVIEVEKSSDLQPKLDEIKGRSEATSISVFRCEQRIKLESNWIASPYTEIAKEPA